MRLRLLVSTATLLLAPVLAHGQSFTTAPCPGGTDSDSSWFSSSDHACELRRATLPLVGGHLGVQGNNGAIEIVGEDRADIALEVKINAQAPSHSDAQALLREIRIVTSGGDIHAEGPNDQSGFLTRHRSWSASFKLRVPRRVAHSDLRTSNGAIRLSSLEGEVAASTSNGSIEVNDLHGNLRASSTNGGLRLENLAGSVHAETTNGGITISLAGDRWRGDGLFARSTNGGITVKAPERFAAHLVADTTNGGIHVDFPINVQGRIGSHFETDINSGGPEVRLQTTNGGVNIDRI